MNDSPIELKELMGFGVQELKDLSQSLQRVIMQAEKLKGLGIEIEGKNLEELMVLIENNSNR